MENLMRRSRLFTLTLVLAFLLAGCNLPSRVLTTGQPPTPMQEPVLADTPASTETSVFDPLLTPTVTPSLAPIKTEEVPPTATPGVLPGVQFSLLAVGRPVQVTSFDMLDLQVGWGAVDSTQNDTSGHLLRTTDGGLTWQEVTSPSGYPWGSRFLALDGLRAWAAPAATGSEQVSGFVWRTEDGGATWLASAPIPLQLQETELVEYYLPQALFFLDDQHGWLVVSMGHYMNQDVLAIYSTSNGGLSWQKLADKFSMGEGEGQDGGASVPCRVSGIAFLDTQVGFLSGDCLAVGVDDGFGLLMTRDGGKTWSAEKIPDALVVPQAVQAADVWHEPFLRADGDGKNPRRDHGPAHLPGVGRFWRVEELLFRVHPGVRRGRLAGLGRRDGGVLQRAGWLPAGADGTGRQAADQPDPRCRQDLAGGGYRHLADGAAGFPHAGAGVCAGMDVE
jgi:hypothetical protein